MVVRLVNDCSRAQLNYCIRTNIRRSNIWWFVNFNLWLGSQVKWYRKNIDEIYIWRSSENLPNLVPHQYLFLCSMWSCSYHSMISDYQTYLLRLKCLLKPLLVSWANISRRDDKLIYQQPLVLQNSSTMHTSQSVFLRIPQRGNQQTDSWRYKHHSFYKWLVIVTQETGWMRLQMYIKTI